MTNTIDDVICLAVLINKVAEFAIEISKQNELLKLKEPLLGAKGLVATECFLSFLG